MPSSACKKKRPLARAAPQPAPGGQPTQSPVGVWPLSCKGSPRRRSLLFFFNDPATTQIYTLSLHDALPINELAPRPHNSGHLTFDACETSQFEDRKSTRLNSSHANILYAVFCLKKKNKMFRILWMKILRMPNLSTQYLIQLT